MFFEDSGQILNIARKTSTAIFVVPDNYKIEIPGAIELSPDSKASITIEQVRNLLLRLNMKQLEDVFVVIRPADAMNDEAVNALLKTLEEPRDRVHFILITSQLSMIIPTVVSRAGVYILKQPWSPNALIETSDEIRQLAKRLLAAKPSDLVGLAEVLTKKRDNVRKYVLDVISVAIEMSYKTYFLTKKPVFLEKTDKLINVYDNIFKNGHIKLHLVADLC